MRHAGMRAAAAVLAADGGAREGGGGSLCELARRVNSLRGATGEGTERETAGKGRKGRSLARSLFPLSLSDHQPAAVAPSPAPLRRCAVLLSGVISWWESEVMARKVSQVSE